MRRLFLEELRALGERAQRATSHREEARRLFSSLLLDGAIKALTPLERRAEPILSLAHYQDPSFKIIYGLDGGSTRPMHFEDGTTLCANQAVFIADPPQRHRGFPLETWRTIALVSHSFQNVGEAHVTHVQNEHVHRWRIHLTKDFVEREVEYIVKSLADVTSEPTHALEMLAILDIHEGLVILDGTLYPIGLYYYLLGELKGEWGYRWGVRLSDREDIVALLANPVRLIEACVGRRLPIVAINKTPETSWLLRFCLNFAERRWASDRQFMTAVLSDTPKDSLGYTNWFVQEAYPSWEERESVVDLPKAVSDFALAIDADLYHVAFFYVYDPRVRSVVKIETPRAVFQFCDPERLRRALLAEIARGKGVPNVIRKADSRARITQEEREALIRACGLDPDYYYNLSRGESL
ncbi:MAG: DNA double-strand break repair nuclease NurA [Candidatus Bipolaricaulota bacterium]|nr:DNA double-strand break repair nuclease NurA [Candidatus Bipolaricaulota bacterium]